MASERIVAVAASIVLVFGISVALPPYLTALSLLTASGLTTDCFLSVL